MPAQFVGHAVGAGGKLNDFGSARMGRKHAEDVTGHAVADTRGNFAGLLGLKKRVKDAQEGGGHRGARFRLVGEGRAFDHGVRVVLPSEVGLVAAAHRGEGTKGVHGWGVREERGGGMGGRNG